MLSKTIGLRTLQIATETDHLPELRKGGPETGSEQEETGPSGEAPRTRDVAEGAHPDEAEETKSSGESLQSVLTWPRRQVN